MKAWHTAIALLILLGLGGILYYLNQRPAPLPAGTIPKEKLFSFPVEQVAEFLLETPGQPPATFRRMAGSQASPGSDGREQGQPQWEIVSPSQIPADSNGIQGFLSELSRIEFTPLGSGSPSTLGDYGLDQPQKVYKFKQKEGQVATLSLGQENPSESGRYGKFDNSTNVFLLDSIDAKALVDKTLLDLRDKRVLPITMEQMQQLEVRFYLRGGVPTPADLQEANRRKLSLRPPKIVLTKLPDGKWQLTNPAVRTDHAHASELVGLVVGGQAQSIEDENPSSLSRYGLDTPEFRVDVITSQGSYSLLVGNRKSGEEALYYAKNSVWPHVFTIGHSMHSELTQDLEVYRNRYLFDTTGPYATRRVEIATSDKTLRFDRKGDGWVNPQNAQQQVNPTKVDRFLEYIYGLRIQYYTTDRPGSFAEYGLDKPWLTLKVVAGEGNREETVLFWRGKDHFYATRQGESSIYELSANDPEGIESRLKELTS